MKSQDYFWKILIDIDPDEQFLYNVTAGGTTPYWCVYQTEKTIGYSWTPPLWNAIGLKVLDRGSEMHEGVMGTDQVLELCLKELKGTRLVLGEFSGLHL